MNEPPRPRGAFGIAAVVIYSGFVGAAWLWLWARDRAAIVPAAAAGEVGLWGAMAIGTAVGLGVSGAFELLARYWRPFGKLEGRLAALLGPLSEAEITLLALSSALGEECFFRLAMQDALGLLPTAVLFGLLHTGPPGLLWSAVALVLGLAFGWMMHAGCGLLSVTLAHALINYLSLRRMQWR